MSDFRILKPWPVEPFLMPNGHKVVGYCDLITGRVRISGCTVVEMDDGRLRLWAPACRNGADRPRALIRFGPELMDEAGEACRDLLQAVRNHRSFFQRKREAARDAAREAADV